MRYRMNAGSSFRKSQSNGDQSNGDYDEMLMGKRRRDDEILSALFFRLLPVQVGLVAMESVNAIIDGVVAGHFIDPAAFGVIGLYYTVLRILEAIGGLLLSGSAVLCGRYLGAGKLEKTRGVCSLSLTVAFLTGALLTIFSFAAPEGIAILLGADASLSGALAGYVKGYGVGILPQLMGQQFAACLQLERQDRRGRLGILVMILCNAGLDLLFVIAWKMGTFGLALATSVSNWAYFAVTAGYFLTSRAQLKPDWRLIDWRELPQIARIGFPAALLVGCLAARSLALNRLLLTYAGADGLSALAAFNMVCSLILAVAIGTGATVRMLSSVLIGEENREGLKSLMRIVFTQLMPFVLALTLAVVLLAPLLAGIFFPDSAGNVFRLTRQLIVIYGCFIPLMLTCIVYSSYAQAAGHRLYVNLVSLSDGFFGVVIPAALLAPVFGALGVWTAFAVSLLITASITLLYILIRSKKWPGSADEWLLLQPEFGRSDHLVMTLHNMDEIMQTSGQVEDFCLAHGLPMKISMHAALCIEEMGGNIVQHGFQADRRTHSIEVRIVLQGGGVILIVKDDCVPFNPKEWYEITRPDSDDLMANIGIRMVLGLAEEVEYQNLLGLNVLKVRLTDICERSS